MELKDKDGKIISNRGNRTGNRVSDIEIIERIGAVYQGLMKGWSRTKLIQYGSNVWGVGTRQVDNYIKRARGIVLGEVTKNMVYDYKLAILRLTELYSKAQAENNYLACRFILNDLHKIQGLYTTKVHVQIDGEVNVTHELAKKFSKRVERPH